MPIFKNSLSKAINSIIVDTQSAHIPNGMAIWHKNNKNNLSILSSYGFDLKTGITNSKFNMEQLSKLDDRTRKNFRNIQQIIFCANAQISDILWKEINELRKTLDTHTRKGRKPPRHLIANFNTWVKDHQDFLEEQGIILKGGYVQLSILGNAHRDNVYAKNDKINKMRDEEKITHENYIKRFEKNKKYFVTAITQKAALEEKERNAKELQICILTEQIKEQTKQLKSEHNSRMRDLYQKLAIQLIGNKFGFPRDKKQLLQFLKDKEKVQDILNFLTQKNIYPNLPKEMRSLVLQITEYDQLVKKFPARYANLFEIPCMIGRYLTLTCKSSGIEDGLYYIEIIKMNGKLHQKNIKSILIFLQEKRLIEKYLIFIADNEENEEKKIEVDNLKLDKLVVNERDVAQLIAFFQMENLGVEYLKSTCKGDNINENGKQPHWMVKQYNKDSNFTDNGKILRDVERLGDSKTFSKIEYNINQSREKVKNSWFNIKNRMIKWFYKSKRHIFKYKGAPTIKKANDDARKESLASQIASAIMGTNTQKTSLVEYNSGHSGITMHAVACEIKPNVRSMGDFATGKANYHVLGAKYKITVAKSKEQWDNQKLDINNILIYQKDSKIYYSVKNLDGGIKKGSLSTQELSPTIKMDPKLPASFKHYQESNDQQPKDIVYSLTSKVFQNKLKEKLENQGILLKHKDCADLFDNGNWVALMFLVADRDKVGRLLQNMLITRNNSICSIYGIDYGKTFEGKINEIKLTGDFHLSFPKANMITKVFQNQHYLFSTASPDSIAEGFFLILRALSQEQLKKYIPDAMQRKKILATMEDYYNTGNKQFKDKYKSILPGKLEAYIEAHIEKFPQDTYIREEFDMRMTNLFTTKVKKRNWFKTIVLGWDKYYTSFKTILLGWDKYYTSKENTEQSRLRQKLTLTRCQLKLIQGLGKLTAKKNALIWKSGDVELKYPLFKDIESRTTWDLEPYTNDNNQQRYRLIVNGNDRDMMTFRFIDYLRTYAPNDIVQTIAIIDSKDLSEEDLKKLIEVFNPDKMRQYRYLFDNNPQKLKQIQAKANTLTMSHTDTTEYHVPQSQTNEQKMKIKCSTSQIKKHTYQNRVHPNRNLTNRFPKPGEELIVRKKLFVNNKNTIIKHPNDNLLKSRDNNHHYLTTTTQFYKRKPIYNLSTLYKQLNDSMKNEIDNLKRKYSEDFTNYFMNEYNNFSKNKRLLKLIHDNPNQCAKYLCNNFEKIQLGKNFQMIKTDETLNYHKESMSITV